jgi:hypothetical protein
MIYVAMTLDALRVVLAATTTVNDPKALRFWKDLITYGNKEL